MNAYSEGGRTTRGHLSHETHRGVGGGGRSSSKWPSALPPHFDADGSSSSSSSSCLYILSAVLCNGCDGSDGYAPPPSSCRVSSSSSSSSSIHWALHEATARTVFHPRIFWKTSAHDQQQQQHQQTAPSALEFFTKYFPETAIQAILGGDNPDIPSAAFATTNNSSDNKALLVQKLLPYWPVAQRIPILFIYVIATNDVAFDSFQHVTSRLPSVRLIRLQETDFFDTLPSSRSICSRRSNTGGVSVERLAALAAAQCMYGGPALVIHGGIQKISFAATAIDEQDDDNDGSVASSAIATQSSSSSSSADHDDDALCHSVRVRGEEIGPGFAAKFFSLQSHYGGGMPSVGFEEFRQYLLAKFKTQKGGETTKTAATAMPPRVLEAHSSKEEVMGQVVQETTSHLCSVIATWATQALASPTFQGRKRRADAKAARGEGWQNKVATCNRQLYVFITGGRQGQLLMDLLSSSDVGAGTSYLHPDLPEMSCKVNFVWQEFLAHHGISHLLFKHHERREQQQQRLVASSRSLATTAAATPASAADHLRTMALGQRVIAPKKLQPQQQLLGRLVIVRGTVVSAGKRQLPGSSSSTNDDIHKIHGVDDANVYHIKYDDGVQDEVNGEELYDALVLYHAEGENKLRGPAGVLNEALDKMRDVKRAAAMEVAKLLEQSDAAVIARVKKTECLSVDAAVAQDKASSNTSSETGKQDDVNVQAKSDVRAMTSSKKASTANDADSSTTSPLPVATKESAATATVSIQLQTAIKNSRFDADKPATKENQALESSKNSVPKPSTGAKEATVPKATIKPKATTAKAATSLKMPKASAAQTSAVTKKKAPTASKKRQAAASAAASKAVKAASATAVKTPKSASTAKAAKRPSPSAVQAPESVKKARKASPRKQNTVAAPAAAPPARQKRTSPTAAAGPIMPPTRKSLQEQPRSYAKQRVAKFFPDGVLYFGYVKYYNAEEELWRIFYDDDDKEDYDLGDMLKYGKEYEKHKNEDPQRKR